MSNVVVWKNMWTSHCFMGNEFSTFFSFSEIENFIQYVNNKF